MSILVFDTQTDDFSNYIHEFDAVSKRTGQALRLTQIGADRKDAEFRLRAYNLGPSFDQYFDLRAVKPETEATRNGRLR